MIEAKIEIYDFHNLSSSNTAALLYNTPIEPLATHTVRLQVIPSVEAKIEIGAHKATVSEISHKIVYNPNNNELSQQSVIIKCKRDLI
ncbi:MAG: hypothetical protein ACRCYJ_18600 [Plesiomonas shigelloides]